MFSGSRRSYGVQGGSSGHRNRWPRRQQYCIGQKSLFHTVSNSYTLCIDNQILLRFDVPDNQILLRFGAPDNQILLHLGVPYNCSSGPGRAGRIYSLSRTPKWSKIWLLGTPKQNKIWLSGTLKWCKKKLLGTSKWS